MAAPQNRSRPGGSAAGFAAGLCDACAHQQLVRTTRGSTFSLCTRSKTEPAYPKYPRLPVLRCAGHEPRGAAAR